MTELTEFQRKLSALLPDVELRFEEALAKHTSFRIGGDAEVMAFPKTQIELADILEACAKLNCKCATLGAGTNVLGPDEGVRGLAVCPKDCLGGMDRPDAPLPIIAMTANLFDEDVAACLAAGMDAHIPKPLEAGQMIRTIAEWLERKKQ